MIIEHSFSGMPDTLESLLFSFLSWDTVVPYDSVLSMTLMAPGSAAFRRIS